MNRPLLLGGIYVVRGLTFILLVQVGADLETLFLFAVLFGLVDYSTVPVTASLVASHIGIRVMGLAFGLISAGHQMRWHLGRILRRHPVRPLCPLRLGLVVVALAGRGRGPARLSPA